MYVCKCEDFEKYMERINKIINSYFVRTGNNKPLGADYKFFKYCPWCGKELFND